MSFLAKIKTKLFPPKKELCTVTFTYAIKPKYSMKASVKSCTKEVVAWVQQGATQKDCIKIFADDSLNSNMTYEIKAVYVTPIKTVNAD